LNVTPLTVLSYAKINLVLGVLGKRPDGYHELRTVFQTIDLHDTLELEPAAALELECSGLTGLSPQQNLVWKAAAALRRSASVERGARIVLSKRIPAGGGLGGGSSNAAAALLGLRKLWDLALPDDQLADIAAGLGADVPFFLTGGTALGIGRGDEIYPVPEITPTHMVLIFPGEGVSTAEAYASLRIDLTSGATVHKIQRFCGRIQDASACAAGLFNDFETSILPARPAIMQAREALLEQGAVAARMSGSGSSVFGFFLDEESALAASRAVVRDGWRVFPAKTLSRADFQRQMSG
jgi:4-diphosphocytidyl-2-C-methyl-D-erythritol kinase